ncbi:MAG: CapA family protein [Alphaproteobacteria bacterium]|nr:CapA family protein [Alphaproteobacteria bacterium]
MLLSLWTSLALAGATPQALLEQGMAAQRGGDVAAAKAAYAQCLAADETFVPCHWEIGWSFWTEGDWAHVVEHWERVKALEPTHPEVDKHLGTAKGHLASLAMIKASASGAPDSVRPPVAAGKTVRIRAVGDIMMGTDFPAGFLPPEDGATVLAGVYDLLNDADVTFGNLEGPLCDGGTTNKCGPGENCYAFRTPTSYGQYLKKAGFDLLSTANNHAEDFGELCRNQTEQTLDGLGIAHSGRPGTLATVEHDGVKIGMIGFHTSRSGHYLNDPDTAAALIKAMKAKHDLVIVSFHGGAEGAKNLHVPDKMETFYGEQRGHLRQFARLAIASGADMVLGHGPHVPRGMELVDGHLVIYSLGNFATYGRFNLSGHLSTSLVLEATLDHEGKLVSGKILPIRLEGEGIPMPDAEKTAIDLIRTLSTEDFGERAPVIAKDGSFAPR